tara:strand:+ start:48 stop:521 length:474 start_codon:yes stop_codon:yes gene_type:complete
MYFSRFDSPIGSLLLAADESGLRQLAFPNEKTKQTPPSHWQENGDFFAETIRQLTAYFAGELRTFDLPLAPQGTPFQLQVWQSLPEIPYGQTTSYAELAQKIGKPSAARDVGAANGHHRHPLPSRGGGQRPPHRLCRRPRNKKALLSLEQRHAFNLS